MPSITSATRRGRRNCARRTAAIGSHPPRRGDAPMRRLLVLLVFWLQVAMPAGVLFAQGPRDRGTGSTRRAAAGTGGFARRACGRRHAGGALAAGRFCPWQGASRVRPRVMVDAGFLARHDRGARGRAELERLVPVLDLWLRDRRPASLLGLVAQAEPGRGTPAFRSGSDRAVIRPDGSGRAQHGGPAGQDDGRRRRQSPLAGRERPAV